ncbi:MFS transporter [Streptomyces sp. XD-27]|uniref:MFS transporter n=1 Tax=Streptomyces sp. XD-27 TaxID=3062779 RepID=UPI0026F454EA|nr:MFS transporter [Streptomyces sp. XD-27]WKX73913.1 MFS transporter [Streptomyces sp. XD-27]
MTTSSAAEPTPPLRRHKAFVLLCAEQAASALGRQVTALALPLLAISQLDAGPFGASALMAMTYLPGVLLSPFIGVLVDRARLRRLVVALTLAQVAIVGTIPLAGAADRLTWLHLYAVALASGGLTSTLGVALQAALPRIVRADQLLAANSALTGARTGGQIGGPALGGVLVGLFGASPALLVDCAAYAVEAVLLLALPAALDVPAEQAGPSAGSRMDALREGLAIIRQEKLLRRQALAAAGLNLGGGAAGALFALYATRDLELPAWQLGVVYATFSLATSMGVLLAGRVAKTIGLGRATQYCAVGAATALFLIPAASMGLAFPVLLVYELAFGVLATVWTIAMTTGRQLVTPAHLQGRVNAFLQAALTGTLPIGALVGGALASRVGMVPVLVTAATVALLAATSLWSPPGLHSSIETAAREKQA